MVMPVIANVKMQGLSHVVHHTISENNEGEKCNVPLKVLDEMDEIKNTIKRISAIKIDVENFEYQVLLRAYILPPQTKPCPIHTPISLFLSTLSGIENSVNFWGAA